MNSLTQNVSCIKKKKSYGYDKKFPQSSYCLLFYICVLITELDSVVCISQRSWNFLRGLGFSYFFIFKTYFALGRGKIALVHWRFCVLAGFFFFLNGQREIKEYLKRLFRIGMDTLQFGSVLGGTVPNSFVTSLACFYPNKTYHAVSKP